jgi:hypothetical protein
MIVAVLTGLMDLLTAPAALLGPVFVIFFFAVLVSAGSLLIFKFTSNQEGIRRTKARIKAGILGMLIFRHDLRRMFIEMGSSFGLSLLNLRYLVLPMLVMIVPLVLVFIDLDLRLGLRSLAVGESAVLRIHLDEGVSQDDVVVVAPEGVTVTSPGVRILDPERGLNEVDFRVRVDAPGDHLVEVVAGGERVTKRVSSVKPLTMLSPVRPRGFLAGLLNPGEDGLPSDSPIREIALAYEPATVSFLRVDWAWWLLFLVFMLPALFVLRGPIGVDF